MNAEMKFKFYLMKNERPFVFEIFPGTPWDDIQEILTEFSENFKQMQKDAIEAESKKSEVDPVVEAPKEN